MNCQLHAILLQSFLPEATEPNQDQFAHVERDLSFVKQVKNPGGRAFLVRGGLHKDQTVNDNSGPGGSFAHSFSVSLSR